jgi:WD40 repeat protein
MSTLSKFAFRLFFFVFVSLLIASAAWADDYRTWTDSTGKHKLRAKLESVEDGKAILLREDGTKVKIALDKLSKADQDFVAKQNTDSPFEKVDEGSDGSTEKSAEPSSGGPRTVKVDWSQSQAVLLSSVDSEWHVTAPAASDAEFRGRSVALPPKSDFFEGITGMAVNRVAKAAAVGYVLDKGDGNRKVRLLLCDLQSGRVTAAASTTGDNMAPLALHDDGRQILMRSNGFGSANQNRLELWTIKGKNISRSLTWTPYEGDWGPNQELVWAEFLDTKRVATCNRGGKVAIWNLATGQPICHVQASDGLLPALSPNRKLIAIAAKDVVGLFDVDKQEVIAAKETPHDLPWPELAFSPSGGKIACISGDRIVVWDTATGAVQKDFALPGMFLHGAIDFPDEGFLLANKQYLIELQNQIKLWHYVGGEQVRTLGGTTIFAIAPFNQQGLLLAARLPHREAAAMLKKALEQPDLFVFRKGTAVKLDVSGIPDAAERSKAEEALTKKLQDLNCTIDPAGQVAVVAAVEGPKSREVHFRHSGTYHVQEYATRLKFVYQGQTLWETSNTNIPGILMLKAGENVEGRLREASAKPSYGLYTTVTLPEFLQKPSDKASHGAEQTLGTSQLSEQGIRSQPNVPPHFKGRKR